MTLRCDLIIRDATVFDGLGRPRFNADVRRTRGQSNRLNPQDNAWEQGAPRLSNVRPITLVPATLINASGRCEFPH